MFLQIEKSQEAKLVNILGESQGRRGNFDRALSLFQEAIELDPKNPDIYNNLGFTYFKKGDYAKAEAMLREALDLDPQHASAGLNLRAILKRTK